MAREMDFVDEYYSNNSFDLLKKLTLIIPTYNRNYYLSRCLWYHAHFPFAQIIIADSSPENKKIINRNTVKKVQEIFGTEICYLEYEPETEKYGGDIYRKWGDAVQHVSTDYSIICIDKSFLNITDLQQKIEFLEDNAEYETAQGIWYMLESDKSGGTVCKYPRDYAPPKNIENDDVILRLSDAISLGDVSYYPQLFSLFRTRTHKKIYRPILEKKINDIRYGEIAISLFPVIYGKHKQFLSHMDLIRDVTMVTTHKGSNKNQSSTLRYPARMEYTKLGILDTCYQGFEESIVSLISETISDDCVHDDIRELSKKHYYSPIMHPRFDLKRFVLKRKVLFDIWNKIPRDLKNIFLSKISYHFDTEMVVKNRFVAFINNIISVYIQDEMKDEPIPLLK